MLKRGASSTNTFKKRKRKRNGISTSSSILDPVDTEKPQLMSVWHTNAEDLSTSRQSMVQVPFEPQIEGPQVEGTYSEVAGEDFEVIAPTRRKVPVQPKRKRGNDSVSSSSSDPTASDIFTPSNRRRWRRGSHIGR